MGSQEANDNEEYWLAGLAFLDSGNYIAVNRTLIRLFGLNEAVILGELSSEAMRWGKEGKLDNGWFFSRVEDLEDKTGLNAYYQRVAIKAFEECGVLEVKLKGMPRKRYIRINFNCLLSIIHSKQLTGFTTSGKPSAQLVLNGFDDTYIDKQPVIETSNGVSVVPKHKQTRFQSPTVDDVAAYCLERKNGIDPQYFVDYYEARGWVLKGGSKMKSWKATVRTWERNNVKGPSRKGRGSRNAEYDTV